MSEEIYTYDDLLESLNIWEGCAKYISNEILDWDDYINYLDHRDNIKDCLKYLTPTIKISDEKFKSFSLKTESCVYNPLGYNLNRNDHWYYFRIQNNDKVVVQNSSLKEIGTKVIDINFDEIMSFIKKFPNKKGIICKRMKILFELRNICLLIKVKEEFQITKLLKIRDKYFDNKFWDDFLIIMLKVYYEELKITRYFHYYLCEQELLSFYQLALNNEMPDLILLNKIKQKSKKHFNHSYREKYPDKFINLLFEVCKFREKPFRIYYLVREFCQSAYPSLKGARFLDNSFRLNLLLDYINSNITKI